MLGCRGDRRTVAEANERGEMGEGARSTNECGCRALRGKRHSSETKHAEKKALALTRMLSQFY